MCGEDKEHGWEGVTMLGWFEPHRCFDENHLFQARYDTEPLMTELNGRMSSAMIEKALVASSRRTYVQDVCVYYGKVAKRV